MGNIGDGKAFRQIVAVQPQQGCVAVVTFDDGTVKILDANMLRKNLKKNEFTAPLFDPDIFIQAETKDGNLVWPNGFDLRGHDLYDRCAKHEVYEGK